MHRLLSRRLPTPPTIILPPYAEQPALPPLDLALLGPTFNIKPAHGGGGEGVVIGATTAEQVQAARQEHPHDHYLLQGHIEPAELADRPAWFRPIFACGQTFLSWWDPQTHIYTPLDPAEEQRLGLTALHAIVTEIAHLCRLDLFSCEIALCPNGRFVVVDYVNDPLDLRLQSQTPEGVPEAIVRSIARIVVARAHPGMRAGLHKGLWCSIMRAGRRFRRCFRPAAGSGPSRSAPNSIEQGVAMVETSQETVEQATPDTPAGAAAPADRLILLRWWDRAKGFIRTGWARRPRRPRPPRPPLPDQEEIARWVALLAYPEDPAHAQALDELVVIGRPAVPALIQALHSETWIQAFRAAEALGQIGDRRAVRPLKRLLDHPNSNVRWGAAEALGRIRSRWARGRLKRTAQEDESRTSWGEPVSEAAERAIVNIEQTWVSRVVNVLWIFFYLAVCAIIIFFAYGFVRDAAVKLIQSMATPTPTVATPQPTATTTPTPTSTPLPAFVPIAGTILSDKANIRDQPDGALIDVLNFGDEVLVYGGRMTEDGTWWYLIRLEEIHNPATSRDGPMGQGAYGWIWSVRVGGITAPEIGPTVAAIETMRAAVATPTAIGSSLELPIPTVPPTITVAPTVTVSP